ncbi:hypothetical protein D3C86_2143050 [compost metagenome]
MTFGVLIFGEYPDTIALVGIFVIASAGLLTVVRERIRGLRNTTTGSAVVNLPDTEEKD